MTIKQTLDADLKTAMLAKDSQTTSVLRGLKSVILYAEVADGSRETGGLDDDAVTTLFAREAKKRQESADLYVQGGSPDKAQQELSEKQIIERYLPTQLTEEEISEIVVNVITELGASGPGQMGQVIGAVKAKSGAAADGATVARLVKARLAS